jgi:hypothetical protein
MKRGALIVGSTTPIGAGLLMHSDLDRYDHLVLGDAASRTYMARELLARTPIQSNRAAIIPINRIRPFAGIDASRPFFSNCDAVDLFYLMHSRDRSESASDVREHNTLMFDRILAIAYELPKLHALVVVTDIGLIGDYPGRFSENWVDVGQTPFDEVDRSSLEMELLCIKEKAFPIIRIRVGLVVDPKGVPSTLGLWPNLSERFVGFSSIVKRMPRLLRLPVAVSKGALAPISPADFIATVMLKSVSESPTSGAIHAVLDPPPSIEAVLAVASDRIGGARLRPGLPIDSVAKLGLIPGFRELARRNADQLAAWWTPHRYCLSRNDVDTTRLKQLLPDSVGAVTWQSVESLFL